MDKFVNIHGHSAFSLLDGATKVVELVDRTLELGQPASCITDHGVMYSLVEHVTYAKKVGQKPIIGFEAYVVNDHTIKDKSEAQRESETKREHMVLLAKDYKGYQRLSKICSIGATDGFYYRPRIDDKVLSNIGTDGIIGTSACLAGRLAQCIIKDDIEMAEKWAIHYFKLFNEDFYLEIQPTISPDQIKVNLGLIEIHKKTGIPIVATTDFHYLKKEDAETHDVLLAIQSKSLLSDPDRWQFDGDTYYVMSRDEILSAFKSNGHEILDQKVIELAVDTTVDIAEKCNVDIKFGKHYLPSVDLPKNNDEFVNWATQKNGQLSGENYLRYLCIKGLKARNKVTKDYRDRLEYELEIINSMGFCDYFLVMEDIMSFCEKNKIPRGPARGSSAGALVSYALGITRVDPLEYDLLFERFLNPGRKAIPDIDSDFCVKNGYKIFDYLIEKYGKEKCCNIATFGRMQLKFVIKDVAKTLGIEFDEVNNYTRAIISKDFGSIDDLMDSPEHSGFLKKYPDLYRHARKLEGLPRHVSQHPAGVCVFPMPVTDLFPVQNAKENVIEGSDSSGVIGYLSQFEKDETEMLGGVKLDILRLKNVTEIQEMIDEINFRYNLNLTDETIPLDDKKTWDTLGKGNTLGVFQFASPLGVNVLKQIKPQNIEELSAANAFIRPGASGLEEYLIAKKDPSKIRKLDPRLDRHLEKTSGAIVYQEQIMQLIAELMGISFGESDLYRRALEKPAKDKDGYVNKFNNEVVETAKKRGFDPDIADLVKHLIIDNIGYGFNKCLSGQEKIYQDKSQHFHPTIEQMYKIKNDRNYAKNNGHYSLWKKYCKSYGNALSMNDEGMLIKNKIVDITYSGKNPVYLIKTESGNIVKCTMNHSLPTPNGKKMLSELTVGDELYVVDNRYEKNKKVKASKIITIEYLYDEDTYNIEMESPYHNLLMDDGIVVSNSHSIAYSLISYWTAWLKSNYPLVFYNITFNGNLGQLSEFMAEAKRSGITILPPHVSHSEFNSIIESEKDKSIRIGFNAIKDIGPKAVEAIINAQPFTSINDFLDRIDKRVVNKRVVEGLIKSGAFGDLGIEIDESDIDESVIHLFEIKQVDEKKFVTLNRVQLEFWYNKVNELNTKKSIPKYIVPETIIKGKYFDKYELIVESDEKGVVIPEDMLGEIEIDLKQVKEFRTRKWAKGSFAKKKEKSKIPILRRPFVEFSKELSELQIDYLSLYLNETKQLGFSFLEHPLENNMDKIDLYDSKRDGDLMTTAGIITGMERKVARNNKYYYWVFLQTPRDVIRFTLWDNQFKKYQKIIEKNNLVVVRGIKGYGGLNVDTIKQLKLLNK